jgi:hypothetical protein
MKIRAEAAEKTLKNRDNVSISAPRPSCGYGYYFALLLSLNEHRAFGW